MDFSWLEEQLKFNNAVIEFSRKELTHRLSDCFVQPSLDAIRTFGVYGFMTEFDLEQDLLDAMGGTLYSGT